MRSSAQSGSGQERVLLGRKPAIPARFVTCLAGFLVPADNLEECVVREVGLLVDYWLAAAAYF